MLIRKLSSFPLLSFSAAADRYNVSHKLTNRILLERLILEALSRKDNRNMTTNQRRVFGLRRAFRTNLSDRSKNNSVLRDFRVDSISFVKYRGSIVDI